MRREAGIRDLSDRRIRIGAAAMAAAFGAAGLATPATGQDAETVGPPQLRDFRLDAPPRRPVQPSVTQDPPTQTPPPAERTQPPPQQVQPAPAPAPAPVRTVPTPTASPPPTARPPGAAPPEPALEPPRTAPIPERVAPPPPAAVEAPVPLHAETELSVPTPTPVPVPTTGRSWLLWLLGTAALGLLVFFGLRRRSQASLSPVARSASAPEPAPQPKPAAPVSIPEPRPWLELDFVPQRAAATESQTEVQFELVVRNGGKVEARSVRIEARMFNASAGEEIETFFRSAPQAAAAGLTIPPGMEARAKSQVMMPLESVRPIRVQERSLFVPLVAFNVFYEWSDGRIGQTSRSWLVGREAQPPADKMGAFRLDLGPRIYRQLGQRRHELARVV
jgi:hypothetical protein